MQDRHPVTARAAQAYGDLADLAETVEDEWQYVNDLRDAYLPGILALAEAGAAGGAAGEGGEGGAITEAQAAALDEAIAEISLITDPHKAIDWLSTFPHVVALALDADLDGGVDASFGDSAGTEPDEDSPFRTLGGFR